MNRGPKSTAMTPSLRSLKELLGSSIAATDGDIGKCGDFLLDKTQWAVRYLVAETHKWLPGRKVLISPCQFGDPVPREGIRHFRVELPRQKIKDSPPLDVDAPVSRRHEREMAKHYLYPPYWGGVGLSAEGFFPGVPVQLVPGPQQLADQTEAPSEGGEGDHLRSANELMGKHVTALDGPIGHLEDLIVETTSWKVRWMIVSTRNWLPGRKVIVSPEWVDEVSDRVVINVSKDRISGSPEFDPGAAVNRDYEGRLYDYYGRPKYW